MAQTAPAEKKGPSSLMKSLLGLSTLHSIAEYAGWSFFMLYAHHLGYDMLGLVLLTLSMWLGALTSLFIIPRMDRYGSFRIGVAMQAVVYILLISPWGFSLFPVLMFSIGVALNMYWVPFNIIFMDELKDKGRATWSSVLFMVISLTGVVIPIMAGWGIERYGFWLPYVVGAAVFLMAAGVINLRRAAGDKAMEPENGVIALKTVKYVKRTRPIAAPVSFEGAWDGLVRTGLPVMAIFVASTAGEYGIILGVFGVGGSFAALVTAVRSDRKMERGRPILAASLLGAAAVTALAFATDELLWTALTGLVFFAGFVLIPFNFTAARELSRGSTESMVAREVYLNVGRVAGTLFIAALVWNAGDDVGLATFSPALIAAAVCVTAMGLLFSYQLSRKRDSEAMDERSQRERGRGRGRGARNRRTDGSLKNRGNDR